MAVTFRFGLHFCELPLGDWRARVRRYDALGFSSITFTDHLVVPQWEPIAALAAVAGVTERIRVGTLVVDNGLRNPVLTAKAAATIDRLSGGRFELGLGAGYVAANFRAAGVSFARASPAPRPARGEHRAHAPALAGRDNHIHRSLLPGDRLAACRARTGFADAARRRRRAACHAPGRWGGRHRLDDPAAGNRWVVAPGVARRLHDGPHGDQIEYFAEHVVGALGSEPSRPHR